MKIMNKGKKKRTFEKRIQLVCDKKGNVKWEKRNEIEARGGIEILEEEVGDQETQQTETRHYLNRHTRS